MMHRKDIFVFVLTTLTFVACAVRDDIPYPIVEGAITAFEVEGQCNEDDNGFTEAVIDNQERTVDVYVSDTVNLSMLRIRRFEVNNDATIKPQPDLCYNAETFPSESFSEPADGYNSCVNFQRDSVPFTLHTYQDYEWVVRVHQVVMRNVQMSGQVGDAVIDPINCSVVVYVSSKQDLSKITVQHFDIGGQHGTVIPDPTTSETYDFSGMCTFQVFSPMNDRAQTWRVNVYHTEAAEVATASAFPHSTAAYISGEVPMGTTPVVEYHAQGTSEWTKVNEAQVSLKGRNYIAALTGLRPGAQYTYRVTGGTSVTVEQTFTTVAEQQMENSGFEEWSITTGQSGKDLYQPWAEGKTPYWGTGNPGATSVGNSNSTYVDVPGRGRVANLQSKYIVIKFAAGNIFTGTYLKTDGSNGILGFGRSYTSFPTKLRFDYKYHSEIINKTGGDWKSVYGRYITQELYEGLKGQPDSCSIYIALGDWEPEMYDGKEYPYIIRTKPKAEEIHLFDFNDKHIIALGQFTKGSSVDNWTTETINLDYRVKDRQPKYVIVVASSSKYGDYFAGGEGSLLQLDNLELLYE